MKYLLSCRQVQIWISAGVLLLRSHCNAEGDGAQPATLPAKTGVCVCVCVVPFDGQSHWFVMTLAGE